MAEFSCTGLDELDLTLQEIAEIPEDVVDEMLNAQADVLVTAQRRKVRAYGIYDSQSTKHVVNSIKKGRVKLRKGQRVIYVSPTGTRKRGNKTTRNAEILFVNEYGKQNQKARPAVRDANEQAAEETTAAGAAVLHRWFDSKGV